jgi:hypothetical protein
MKLSNPSIKKLSHCIVGDSSGKWQYRKGRELIEFFNKYGFDYEYGSGFPERIEFAQNRIIELNGDTKLKNLIRDLLDPRDWMNGSYGIADAVQELNNFLRFDGYLIVEDGNFYKVREASGMIIIPEINFDESFEFSEQIIAEHMQKCKEKIEKNDYSGAITNARGLVEAICRKIESECLSITTAYDGDLIQLFNRTAKILNLDPSRKDISISLKQIISGLFQIINGLAQVRNKMSDAHGASYKPSRHHAKLAVNSAMTLIDFLFDSMNYQKIHGILKNDKLNSDSGSG